MANETAIAWCDHTFNPWMGCSAVSAGCDNCYARELTKNRMGLDLWNGNRKVTKSPWQDVVKANRDAERDGVRRRVFMGSLCDFFDDHPVATETRLKVWTLINCCPWLDWQILTKRPERIAKCLPAGWPWPHVWLGTSVESMAVASRVDHLRSVPAVVRFISYEPALGPLDGIDLEGIDWLIYGGESGPNYRQDDPDWARSIRDTCRAAGVAFFYKQTASKRPGQSPTLDGEVIREFPSTDLSTRTLQAIRKGEGEDEPDELEDDQREPDLMTGERPAPTDVKWNGK